jgi:hypothetical protein
LILIPLTESKPIQDLIRFNSSDSVFLVQKEIENNLFKSPEVLHGMNTFPKARIKLRLVEPQP